MSSSDADAAALAERLAAAGVENLLVQFADVHGTARGKLVPLAHLGTVLGPGAGFSGPSIWGTGLERTGWRSEYMARGDASTAVPLPWMPGIARIVGDGWVGGEPFDACPRQVLKRAVAALAKRGWVLQAGIEPEFFLLRRDAASRWQPADADDRLAKPSYDLKSLGRQLPLLMELQRALAACGFDVQQVDHEDAHGQFEVNFAHADALASADRLMLFKLAAHTLAERHGLAFSMMPKPFADQPGSGLHFHLSLWSAGDAPRCVFDAPAAKADLLGPLGRQFVAGVLAHAPALCALACPTVNSYKRLGAGTSITGSTWVPALAAHGPNNRTAMLRTLPGRFEWRLPDASANPYLALAAVIAAGLDGIDRALEPPTACDDDLTLLTAAQADARGLPRLPRDLDEALDALQADAVVRGALGETLAAQFVQLKRAEALEHAQHVSAWELERYATAF